MFRKRSIFGGWISALALAAIVGVGVPADAQSTLSQDPEILADHYRLAEALRQNDSVPADVVRGMQLHVELVNAGHVPSFRRLGVGYVTGIGIERDMDKGLELLRAAIAGGDPAARIWLGRGLILQGTDPEDARRHLSEAVALGLPRADFYYARAQIRGSFGALSDPAEGVAILTSLAATGDQSAMFELATAYRQGDPAILDQEKARGVYQALVDAGDPRSGEELGEMYRDGQGGAADPDHAMKLFSWAAANGRDGAAVKLVTLLQAAGQFAEARSVMVERSETGAPGAKLDLALADVASAFGPASEPEAGKEVLSEIAANPTRDSALQIAQYLEDRSLPPEIGVAEIAETLRLASLDGDGGAAEAVITLSRQRPELFEDALTMRSALLAQYAGDLGAGYFEETVRLIGERSPGASGGGEAIEVLAAANGDEFSASLLAAYAANRNLYVYLLQDEMRKKGLYGGPLNGVANSTTISSIMDLCEVGDITGTCAVGPLGPDAASALAGVLAGERQPGT
ncbi:MAG: tetratricopeptide repeat protein [Pseudomonadota bacterium]